MSSLNWSNRLGNAMFRRSFFAPVALAALPLLFAAAGCAGAGRAIPRSEVVRIAESYRWHRWTPMEKNIKHGPDRDGIRVDTPDYTWRAGEAGAGYWAPGIEAVGMPYKWGGFDTPASFDRGLGKGLAGGDVFSSAKRLELHRAVSRRAVGVDCSGFVSRCWRLARHFSTRDLPLLCEPVAPADLRPGDILNSRNNHVLLFAGWLDGSREWMLAWQAGTETNHKVVCSQVRTGDLLALGYQPLRYRKILDR